MAFKGVLPLSMLLCLLINSLKGTFLSSKLFWIVLAYALASAYHATQKGRRHMVLPQEAFHSHSAEPEPRGAGH